MGHVPAGIVIFFAAFGVAGVAAGRGPWKGGASRGPGGGQRRQGEGWGLGAYGWAVAWPGEGGSIGSRATSASTVKNPAGAILPDRHQDG